MSYYLGLNLWVFILEFDNLIPVLFISSLAVKGSNSCAPKF